MEHHNKKYDQEEHTAIYAGQVRDFCLRLIKNMVNVEYIRN